MYKRIFLLFFFFIFFFTLITANAASHKENFEQGKKAYKNKQYTEALKNFRIAAANKPDTAKYHYNLGLAARKLKYYREAYDAFMKAQELDPDIEFTNKRDEFFKKLDEMKSKAGKVERRPAEPGLSHKEYFEVGKKAYKNKQYKQAFKNFEKAIAKKPDIPKYHYNFGLAARKLKHYETAYNAFMKAQELDPDIEFTNKRAEFRKKLEEAKNRVDFKDKKPVTSTRKEKKKKKGGLPIVPIAVFGGIILLFIIGSARSKRRRGVPPMDTDEDLLENDRSRVISSTRYIQNRRPRFWKKRRRKYRDDMYDDHRYYDDYRRDHGYRPDTDDYISRRDES